MSAFFVKGERKMSDYKSRMKQEYLELTTRISKLHRMIVMSKADKLEFKL